MSATLPTLVNDPRWLEWEEKFRKSTDAETIAHLNESLTSREVMRYFMRDGKETYWAFRLWAANRIRVLTQGLSHGFNSDFHALTQALQLLHILSRETDLDADEAQLVARLKGYVKTRSQVIA